MHRRGTDVTAWSHNRLLHMPHVPACCALPCGGRPCMQNGDRQLAAATYMKEIKDQLKSFEGSDSVLSLAAFGTLQSIDATLAFAKAATLKALLLQELIMVRRAEACQRTALLGAARGMPALHLPGLQCAYPQWNLRCSPPSPPAVAVLLLPPPLSFFALHALAI